VTLWYLFVQQSSSENLRLNYMPIYGLLRSTSMLYTDPPGPPLAKFWGSGPPTRVVDAPVPHFEYPGGPLLTRQWCFCFWRQKVTDKLLIVAETASALRPSHWFRSALYKSKSVPDWRHCSRQGSYIFLSENAWWQWFHSSSVIFCLTEMRIFTRKTVVLKAL